ncbi:kinase-like protein, partial [Neolentinus lepideus HHB14362 ss-1]
VIWHHLSHAHLVPLCGVAYSIPHIISIVTPYYEAGNVINYLRKKGKEPLLKLVRDVAAGLHYLHSKSVLHKDLRGTKVLVDAEGNARITDIGLGPVLVNHAFTTVNMAGVGRWQAPEVILDEEENPNGPYTRASDVYAFAMLIVEMITLERPFSHQKSDTGVVLKVVQGDRPRKPDNLDEVQSQLWLLAQHCWVQNPAQRPDMAEVHDKLQVL